MSNDDIVNILFQFIFAISTLVIVLGIMKWKNLNSSLKFFLRYCIVGQVINLFIQSVGVFKGFFKPLLNSIGISNMSSFDYFYFLRNFLLLGLFYSLLLAPRKIGQWIRYVGIGLAIACTINYLFIEGYKGFGVFNPTVDAIFCFAVPLIYCRVMFQQDDEIPLSKNPYFWITIGQLQVALIGFFLFFTEDFIIKSDPELFNKLAVGRNVLMIIEQIMYAIAFYYAKNTRFLNLNYQN